MIKNRASIIGYIGTEPDFRDTGAHKLCSFNVGVTEKFKASNGEWTSTTSWFRVVAWNLRAEQAKKTCKKGCMVAIEGRMSQRKYKDDKGVEKTVFEIIAEDLIAFHKDAEKAGFSAQKEETSDDLPY